MHFSVALTAVKGLITGIAMMIPGVSGGTVAMVLNIYDDLIEAVSWFAEHKKKSALFLLAFSVPALIGIVLLSKPLVALIAKHRMICMFFFMGAVAGSLPMIYRSAHVRRVDWKFFVCIAIGAAFVTAVRMIPENFFALDESGPAFYLMQILGGFLVAVALVLPGISVSYMLVVMGLYEPVMLALGNLDILSILPIAVASLVCTVIVARIMDRCMRKFPFATYLVILGFVLGSLVEVFPGLPGGRMIAACAAVFLMGFLIIFFISRPKAGAGA